MAILTPDKITNCGGVNVCEYLLTRHNPNKIAMPIYNLPEKPIGVTVHNTDWITTASNTTPAEQYTRATVNGNMNDVRVHYYVDHTCAWQTLPLTLAGWHAADGSGNGNRKTIAIECIMSSAYNDTDKKSEDNCAKLAAYLLYSYGLSINELYTHTHWLNVRDGVKGDNDYLNTRRHPYKWCPLYILPHWASFKAKVQQYLNQLYGNTATTAPTQNTVTGYIKTLEKGTPIYKEIGGAKTSEITSTTKYTIIEDKVVNGVKYGKLKSGAGWVELERIVKIYDINNKDDVKALQNALNAKGFNCGTADGVVGTNTTKAMFNALCKEWFK